MNNLQVMRRAVNNLGVMGKLMWDPEAKTSNFQDRAELSNMRSLNPVKSVEALLIDKIKRIAIICQLLCR